MAVDSVVICRENVIMDSYLPIDNTLTLTLSPYTYTMLKALNVIMIVRLFELFLKYLQKVDDNT